MVAIGDFLDAGKLLFGDIFASALTLFWDDAVGSLVARSLPACDCWYDRASGDDFVGFEALDLGDSLGVGGVAGGVDDEEVVGCLFGDDTAKFQSIRESNVLYFIFITTRKTKKVSPTLG